MRLLSKYWTRRDWVPVGSSTYSSRAVQLACGPQYHERATACVATSESVRFHRAAKVDVSGGTSCLVGAAGAASTDTGLLTPPEGTMLARSRAAPPSETSFCLFKTILLGLLSSHPRQS